MREINGKIGARNDDDSTLEIFIVAHLPLQNSYTGRKGKEMKGKEGCVLGAASQASSISSALLLL